MSRRLIRIAGSLLITLAALSCGTEEPIPEPTLRPVRYMKVAPPTDISRVVIAGVARSGTESSLSLRVSGTVVKVGVTLGDQVRKGQVLLRLDASDYELRVEEAVAATAQARASLRRSQADYIRVRDLYEYNNASKSELDAARAGAESAQAQLDAGDKQLEQARRQVRYTTLVAPVAGIVAGLDVEVNETIRSGQPVVRLASGDQPEIELAVSEVTIPLLSREMPATVRLDALKDRVFEGHVTEVGVATGSNGSTYLVKVRLDAANGSIRSGMAAEATFELATPADEGLVIVPLVAVGEDPAGRHVFVIEPVDDEVAVARRRPVEVGELLPEGLALRSGVSVGELIATAGVRRLVDGMRVRFQPGDAAAGEE